MVALSNKTPKAQLRREVEARTGTCQNMKEFGFKAVKFTLKGEPTRFVQTSDRDGPYYFVQRAITRQWRIGYCAGTYKVQLSRGASFMPEKKVDSPLFPGPVAAAIWLQVEIANGSVRFTTS